MDTSSNAILHCLGVLHRGGIETWLLNLLDCQHHLRPRFDILVTKSVPGDLEQDFVARGCRIYRCPTANGAAAFATRFTSILQRNQYVAVHSHVHHFSGVLMALTAYCGIKHRFVHSHNDTAVLDRESTVFRRLYRTAMQLLVNRFATAGIAVSRPAAAALFGDKWHTDPRWAIIPCGIDLARIRDIRPNDDLRRRLGLPRGATVFMNIGRLCAQKNQKHLIRAFSVLRKSLQNSVLILIGEGADGPELRHLAEELSLGSSLLMLGSRPDALELLSSCADVFVFPSTYEGLGLAAIEAQAFGVPSVLSSTLPAEAVVIKRIVTQVRPDATPEEWAAAMASAASRYRLPRSLAASLIESRGLAVDASAALLAKFYQLQLSPATHFE